VSCVLDTTVHIKLLGVVLCIPRDFSHLPHRSLTAPHVITFSLYSHACTGGARGNESDDGEDPASSVASDNTRNTLAPIGGGNNRGKGSVQGARKRSVDRLPEVQ